jgi:hypothetical protein
MSNMTRRIAVYYPSKQHSLLLARTLVREGYDTLPLTRFETESALRQSMPARLARRPSANPILCSERSRTEAPKACASFYTAESIRTFGEQPNFDGALVPDAVREIPI